MNRRRRKSQELVQSEAMTAECEEIIRIVGKALDLVPVGQIRAGGTWMPSDQAIEMLAYAKDRLTEWRNAQ